MGCVLKQGNPISYFKSRPCHICCNLWWPSAICLIVKQWKAIWVSWQTNQNSFSPTLFSPLLPLFSSLCLLNVCPPAILLVVFTKESCICHVEQNYCDSATLGPLEWSLTRSLYVHFVLKMKLVWKVYFKQLKERKIYD